MGSSPGGARKKQAGEHEQAAPQVSGAVSVTWTFGGRLRVGRVVSRAVSWRSAALGSPRPVQPASSTAEGYEKPC